MRILRQIRIFNFYFFIEIYYYTRFQLFQHLTSLIAMPPGKHVLTAVWSDAAVDKYATVSCTSCRHEWQRELYNDSLNDCSWQLSVSGRRVWRDADLRQLNVIADWQTRTATSCQPARRLRWTPMSWRRRHWSWARQRWPRFPNCWFTWVSRLLAGLWTHTLGNCLKHNNTVVGRSHVTPVLGN